MNLNAQTHLVGLIGFPVSHSVSPDMHNAAFAKLGLDYAYVPLPVNPNQSNGVKEAVKGLRALGFTGANVTVPHKSAVIPFLDRISDAAREIGAVNTISIRTGIIEGDNTDGSGFLEDLQQHSIDPHGMRTLILGAGGAAKGITHALGKVKADEMVVADIDNSLAMELSQSLANRFPGIRVSNQRLTNELELTLRDSDLIINCTPVGMEGFPETQLTIDGKPIPFSANQVFYDLIYTPAQTPTMKQAERCGATSIGGLGMLVRQGAESFLIWTGQAAPVDTMFAAARARLAANTQPKE